MSRLFFVGTLVLLVVLDLQTCIAWIVREIETVPVKQIDVLQDIYDSTNGIEWRWKDDRGERWNFTTEANPCADHWQGVTCRNDTQASFIIGISLPTYGLVGELPLSIGNLTTLVSLELGSNSLTSGIPSTLCNISTLLTVDLSYNSLTGSIPSCFGNYSLPLQTLRLNNNKLSGPVRPIPINLVELNLANNDLTGSLNFVIPVDTPIDEWSLQQLDLAHNQLSGHLPVRLLEVSTLQNINIANNLLSGPLPHYINTDGGTQLTTLSLSSNTITGPLPTAIGNLTSLAYLRLSNNQLSQALPADLLKLINLVDLELAANALTGSIPRDLDRLPLLQSLNVQANQLSGTLPDTLCRVFNLTVLNLANNRLLGSIPTCIGSLVQLRYLYISSNLLTGTLPDTIGGLQRLQSLNVSDNTLTGSLPTALANLAQLQILLCEDNALFGSLDNVFDARIQRNLTAIQLSNNQLTGTLPDEIFRLVNLNVFAAVSNCFDGSLSVSICNCSSLVTLALDGLQSATSCQQKLLPELLFHSSAYTVGTAIHGGVPACLFGMPHLTTLHLSGNGLTGTLPEDLDISPALAELSLSHNQLTGAIPLVVQQRSWYVLDLSYNCLSGTLADSFSSESTQNSTLYLEQNRLSGRIPRSIAHVDEISILGSNLFTCKTDRSDLPENDNDRNTYQCGSDAMNSSGYSWLVLTVGIVVVLGMLWRNRALCDRYCCGVSDSVVNLRVWWGCVSTSKRKSIAPGYLQHLTESAQIYSVLCKLSILCTAVIVVVLLPVYAICDYYYATLSHKYAWTVSAAYLSGQTTFALEVVCYMCLLVFTFVALLMLLERRQPGEREETGRVAPTTSSTSQVFEHPSIYAYGAVCVVFVAINFSVTAGANIAYIYVALTQSDSLLSIAQILLSAFKFALNTLISPYLIHVLSEAAVRYVHKPLHPAEEGTPHFAAADFISVQLFVALFNTIAIPCLVVAVISNDCFVNVFKDAPSVDTMFTYRGGCIVAEDDTGGDVDGTGAAGAVNCASYEILTASTSYVPPFQYSYQCSSSFITYYAPTYANLCIMASFFAPLGQVALQQLHRRARRGTCWYRALHAVLPRSLKPLDTESGDSSSLSFDRYPPFFNASQLFVSILTYFGMLLTFGVVFPPLAVMLMLTILSVTAFGRWKVGRLLYAATLLNLFAVVSAVDKACRGIGSAWILRRSVRTVIGFAWCFYTLFLFDTLGDAVGFKRAYWVLIVMPLMPVAMLLAYKTWEKVLTPRWRSSPLESMLGQDIGEAAQRDEQSRSDPPRGIKDSDESVEAVEEVRNVLAI